MTLDTVIILLIAFVFGIQFWRIRAITEAVNTYAAQYCDKHQLQLLSVARKKTRLSFKLGKFDWHNEFIFEFSSNGEDSYQGHIECIGHKVIKTDVPVYRLS